MQWIKPDINIDFVGFRYKAFLISGITILIGLAVLFWRGGLNMGVDFAGGTLIQVQFSKPTTPDDIRNALREIIPQSTIQQVGAGDANEFLIRADVMPSELQSLSDEVQQVLSKSFGEGQVTVRRVEMVGPKVGADLREKALKAVYYALLFMAIYISGRFEFKWAISGIMGRDSAGGGLSARGHRHERSLPDCWRIILPAPALLVPEAALCARSGGRAGP